VVEEDVTLHLVDDPETKGAISELQTEGDRLQMVDSETAIRRFLERGSAALVENPLFRRTISRDERDRIQVALPDEEITSTRSEKLSLLVPYLEAWQERGLVELGDPEVIGLAILYVSYLPLHRDEFGSEQYLQVRSLLFDWVATSLTR
jgi:hypothetical protein